MISNMMGLNIYQLNLVLGKAVAGYDIKFLMKMVKSFHEKAEEG
jgi:hypothetical protein